mmetsp:Transcript_23682/g.35313  ORF Transcript_23682/g.35313 Transcript_23682/m.35313 type:complete len:130 (-) Transcript_23682:1314-1703(-)
MLLPPIEARGIEGDHNFDTLSSTSSQKMVPRERWHLHTAAATAALFFRVQCLRGGFVPTIQVFASFAAQPEFRTAREPSCTDSTATHILANIQSNITTGGTVTYINTGEDFDEIFVCHPKSTIIYINEI